MSSDNWISLKNNEVLYAYKNFKKHLLDKIQLELDEKLNIAKNVVVDIYVGLNNAGIRCNAAYLRANSLISFDAIIVISENSFLSDYFDKAHEIAFRISKEHEKEGFSFDFSFMPSTRKINNDKLISDGFCNQFFPNSKY